MPRAIAVLIPCLNESAAIAQVVRAFRAALPGARIYVYDNGSTDDSRTRAVRLYGRWLFPLSRVLDTALGALMGKNLVLRAVRI
jgi:glycosyltransferase involved in cell wall biosynthesis